MTVFVVIELSTGVAMPYVFSTFEAANEWLTFGPAPQPRAGYIVACEVRELIWEIVQESREYHQAMPACGECGCSFDDHDSLEPDGCWECGEDEGGKSCPGYKAAP